MKAFIYTLIVSFFVVLWADNVYADAPIRKKPKPQSKTSCTKPRGKFTVSDQIEYHVGVVAGQNIATIKGQKSDSQDVITGLMGGVAFQAVWPKGFVVQPEVLYSRKGCIFSDVGVRYHVDYLEVPVKFTYRLHMAEVKPFAFVAPYGAYAIRLIENGNMTSDDTYSKQINKMDYGIGAGAGFDVWKIQLSFKYTWGFVRVIKDPFPMSNRVFTVSAGFLF